MHKEIYTKEDRQEQSIPQSIMQQGWSYHQIQLPLLKMQSDITR